MNKIIIVGHPLSGIEEVEKELRQSGLKHPLPSRREGLLPTEIINALSQAHQVPGAASVTQESGFNPVRPSSVWELTILDLLLGNIGTSWWGWADPQAIFFLDYWCELDPLACFLMVYDDPREILAAAIVLDDGEPTEATIQQQLASWAAYNGAMLRFFLHHPDRCLLVNSQQVQQTPEDLLRLLNSRSAGTPLAASTDPAHQTAELAPSPASRENLRAALALTTHHSAKSLRKLQGKPTEDYLLDHYLSNHPQRQEFFLALQAAATLPLLSPAKSPPSAGQAWASLVEQRRLSMDVIVQLHQERHLFLMQLHEIQAQLETLHMRGLTWEKEQLKQELKQKIKKSVIVKGPSGAADRIRQQLSYRLGNTLVKRSRSVGGWLGMPFALAGQVSTYRRDQKRLALQKIPPIHRYVDAREADRVKKQLSYRLGSVLVKHAASPLGWFRLPLAMRKEITAFNEERKSGKDSSSSRP